MSMTRTRSIIAAAVLCGVGCAANAQSREGERPEEARDAYRRGYDEGFERGYQKGVAEGERRATTVAQPPPPRAPLVGPIRVTGAFYGTSSHNCDATRQLSRRANGKRSYSFEVTNEICGDPAHGDRKSLEVTYRCGEVVKTASANEHRTIYLDCR
jgi:hypothetical protein